MTTSTTTTAAAAGVARNSKRNIRESSSSDSSDSECNETIGEIENEIDISTPSSTNSFSLKQKCVKKRRLTKFNTKWIKTYPWIAQDKLNESYAYCVKCSARFSVAGGGDYNIKKHENSIRHKDNVLKSTESNNKIEKYFECKKSTQAAVAEAVFAFHTVYHSHSFVSTDCFSQICKQIFPDSEIAKNFCCGRTKTSKIIQNILKPVSKEIIISDLQNHRPFSIATDASNKGNVKTYPLMVTYFTKEKGICNKLLCFFSLDSEKSKDIAQELVKNIQKEGLFLDDITAYCADNASVNFGNKQSVITELKQLNPNIIPFGCICHILHNAAKKGATVLRYDIESIILKCFSEFSSSTKNVSELKEFVDFCNLEWAEILRHTPTRWLTLVPAAERILKLFEPLKHYFLQKQKPKYLEKFFSDELAECYLTFISHIGTVLNKTITLLESNNALVPCLSSILENLKQSLIEKKDNQFFGYLTMMKIKDCTDVSAVSRFKRECCLYIDKILEYLCKKFDFESDLKLLSIMELEKVPSFNDFVTIIEKFNLTYVNIDTLFEEYVELKNYLEKSSLCSKGEDMVAKWQTILNDLKLKELEKIANFVFSLPNSNAISERIFSLMQNIWRKERNKLNLENVEAELMIKNNFKMNCKQFKEFLSSSPQGQSIIKGIKSNKKYE